MSSKFFSSIIDDEKIVFGVKNETLKCAAKDVAKSYSRNALNKGATYLDYNSPSNRCAYLYKYGAIHTALVTKYFRKLVRVKEVKALLQRKEDLKIVCLGGGPGTDVIGIFKALSVFPCFHKKVSRVTILDICGGWRNSFKRIMGSLCLGQVKDVPPTFVDCGKVKTELISVDLLGPLPNNVIERLSNADIVCMVKFVSAILGKPTSVKALQVIGEHLKTDSVVLFIDNFQGSVFKPVENVSNQAGLQIVLGPLHESFPGKIAQKVYKGHTFFSSKEKKEIFGCVPLLCTKISVIGFIKNRHLAQVNVTTMEFSYVSNTGEDDDGWDTQSEHEESDSAYIKAIYPKIVNNAVPQLFCDKFTQTNGECYSLTVIQSLEDLNSLLSSLKKLLDVVNEWKKHKQIENCCHCIH